MTDILTVKVEGREGTAPLLRFVGMSSIFAIAWSILYSPVLTGPGNSDLLAVARISYQASLVAGFIILVAAHRWASKAIHGPVIPWIVCALYAIGAVFSFAAANGLAPRDLFAAGVCLIGLSTSWLFCTWGSVFRFFSPSQASIIVVSSFIVGIFLFFLVYFLAQPVSLIVFIALPFLSTSATSFARQSLPSRPVPPKSTDELRLTRQLVAFMVLFSFACDYLIALRMTLMTNDANVVIMFAVIAVALLLMLVQISSKSESPVFQRRLIMVSFVAIASLLLSTVIPEELFPAVIVLIVFSALIIDVMFWSLLATIERDTRAAAFRFFCLSILLISAAKLLGTILGVAIAGINADFATGPLPLIIAYAIMAFTVALTAPLLRMGKTSTQGSLTSKPLPTEPIGESIGGTYAMGEEGDALPEAGNATSQRQVGQPERPTFDEVIADMGRAYRLTPRECEVFGLLARGRNAAYIQEEFTLSQSTAKTHIKHIYVKLDVHSAQELLDLVESHYERR